MKNIAFLGCGKMGSVLLNNLLENKVFTPEQFSIIEPNKIESKFSINQYSALEKLPQNYKADLIFIAVKPQVAQEIISSEEFKKIHHKNSILVSILAGKKIGFFEKILGKSAKIIRSMPNMASQYSLGIFAYQFNKNFTDSEKKQLAEIFDKFGQKYEITAEKNFDNFTAIFGSGPAYIFLLQQIMSELAVAAGIKENEAEMLVKQLFLGSSTISQNSAEKFSKLAANVASKGGTTEAALNVFNKNDALKKLVKKAIKAAENRSKELSK